MDSITLRQSCIASFSQSQFDKHGESVILRTSPLSSIATVLHSG